MSEETTRPTRAFFGLGKFVPSAIRYIKGDTGAQGPEGPQGPQGPAGDPKTPSDATPQMDGAGAAGTSTTYARGDHRHPTDDTRASVADATLTEIHPWTVVAANPTTIEWGEFEGITGWMPKNNGQTVGVPKGDASSTSLSWNASANPPEAGYDITATRSSTALQLGSQSDKPLAPAGNYALKSEIPLVPVKSVKRNGSALVPDSDGAVNVTVPTTAANVGAANQTAIASAFTAKEYAVGELATYNGLLYRCKSEYTATASSAKPDADTTHWEAAVVAVLLDGKVSKSGDTMTGTLTVLGDGYSRLGHGWVEISGDAVGTETTQINDGTIQRFESGVEIAYLQIPNKDGMLSVLEDIASRFSNQTSYVIGQLVVYDGVLYRCTTAHSAGVWNANDFTAATVEDALAAIRASIPAAQVNADWNAASGVAQILNKPTIPDVNCLPYASTTTLSPETAVYMATATSGVFPTITTTNIPTAAAYFAFELEVTVPSGATLDPTAVSGWTWMDGGELPTSDYAGKTLYIACRLDCTARTIVANCYDVR